MADAIQQNFRAAYLDMIEAAQPIELTCRAKENTSGIPWKSNENEDTTQTEIEL